MTSKERAALRAQANTIDTTLMVGKGGVSETLVAEAQKLLDKVDNLTGMDGDKLFEIAKKCRYGLTEQDGRWRIDDALLLAE